MKRRNAVRGILSLVLLNASVRTGAQSTKRFRMGWLWVAGESAVKPFEQALLAGLRDRGYLVGQNLAVDIRYGNGDPARLPALADELIALNPDVLVGIEAPARAFKAKTSTIPIVLTVPSGDLIADGFVKSHARPGTNVTGMAWHSGPLVGKQVEFLSELVPRMSRLVLLLDDTFTSASAREQIEQSARTAARSKGSTVTLVVARDSQSLREAFAVIEKERPDALLVQGSGSLNNLRREISEGARRLRLPAVTGVIPFADAGLLLAYGANLIESHRYAARYVDQILKGANAAELPMEQPAVFELVINMKTARELGLTIPQSMLLRADRVIE